MTIDEAAIFAMLMRATQPDEGYTGGGYAVPEGFAEPVSYEDWAQQNAENLRMAAEFYAENPLPPGAQDEIRKMIDSAKAAGANDMQAAVLVLINSLPGQQGNEPTLLGLLGYFANEK